MKKFNLIKEAINNFYNKIWEKRDLILKNESVKKQNVIRIISRSLIIIIILLTGFAIKEQIQGDFPIFEKVANGAICNDGSTSESQGPGTCSHHGGVDYYIFESIQIGTHYANPNPYYYTAFILVLLIIITSIFQRSYRWVSIKFIVDIIYWTCFMFHRLVLFIFYIPYILFFPIYIYIHPIIIYFRKKGNN